VECKNKGDTSNNRGDWGCFKVIHKIRNIPGKQEVKELQKTAILGTAHILRKVLILKYNRFNTETNDMSTMNSYNRIAATLYSLGTSFLWNISINTVHKGDDDDNDDDSNNNNNNKPFPEHYVCHYLEHVKISVVENKHWQIL